MEKHIELTSNQKQNRQWVDWVENLCSQRRTFLLRLHFYFTSRFNKILYWIFKCAFSRVYRAHCYIPARVLHLRLLLILITLSYFSATSFININCHVHNVKCASIRPRIRRDYYFSLLLLSSSTLGKYFPSLFARGRGNCWALRLINSEENLFRDLRYF